MMIPKDKLMHAAGGAIAAATVLVLLYVARWAGPGNAMLLGAVLVGVGYEAVQKIRGEGTVDVWDAMFAGLGGAIVTMGALAAKLA